MEIPPHDLPTLQLVKNIFADKYCTSYVKTILSKKMITDLYLVKVFESSCCWLHHWRVNSNWRQSGQHSTPCLNQNSCCYMIVFSHCLSLMVSTRSVIAFPIRLCTYHPDLSLYTLQRLDVYIVTIERATIQWEVGMEDVGTCMPGHRMLIEYNDRMWVMLVESHLWPMH